MNDETKIQPHDFKDRIVFMSMYNDIDWTKKDNRDTCYPNSSRVSEYAFRFPAGDRTFLDISRLAEMRKSGIWTLSYKPDGEWNRTAEVMMLQFAESGHLVFRGTRPLSRGTLKSKGGGKTCIHNNAEPQTA